MQFKPGSKVKVFETFEEGGVSDRVLYAAAIVQGNYPLLCAGHPYTEEMVESYGLLILNEKGEPDYTVCWFEGAEFELLSSDLNAGFELLAQFQAAKVGSTDDEEVEDEDFEDEEDEDEEDEDEEADSDEDDDEEDEDFEGQDEESGPAQIVRVRIDDELKAIFPAESLFVAASNLKLHVKQSPVLNKIEALFIQAPETKYTMADRVLAAYIPDAPAGYLTLNRNDIIELNLLLIAFNDTRNNFERVRFIDLTLPEGEPELLKQLPAVLNSAFESPYGVMSDLSDLIMELAENDGLLPDSESVIEFEAVNGDLQEWFFFGFDDDTMEDDDEDEDEDDFEDDIDAKVVEMRERLSALSRENLERVCDGVQVAHKGFTDKKIVERLVDNTGFKYLAEQLDKIEDAAQRF